MRWRIVYYHWMERGDDLYYEFAWGFDYRDQRELEIAVPERFSLAGERLALAHTYLTAEPRSAFVSGAEPSRPEIVSGHTGIYAQVPRYFGRLAAHNFFAPDIYNDFDWQHYQRIRSG